MASSLRAFHRWCLDDTQGYDSLIAIAHELAAEVERLQAAFATLAGYVTVVRRGELPVAYRRPRKRAPRPVVKAQVPDPPAAAGSVQPPTWEDYLRTRCYECGHETALAATACPQCHEHYDDREVPTFPDRCACATCRAARDLGVR